MTRTTPAKVNIASTAMDAKLEIHGDWQIRVARNGEPGSAARIAAPCPTGFR